MVLLHHMLLLCVYATHCQLSVCVVLDFLLLFAVASCVAMDRGLGGAPLPLPHSHTRDKALAHTSGGGEGQPSLRASGRPHRGNVTFGGVVIAEHEQAFADNGSGAPLLVLGPRVRSELRRLDRLEAERAPVRRGTAVLKPLTSAQRSSLAGVGAAMFAEGTAGGTAPPRPRWSMVLEQWSLAMDGGVHHSGGITSPVTQAEGRLITTAAHGSVYRLGGIREDVRDVLSRLLIPFDPDAPLAATASIAYACEVAALVDEALDTQARLKDLWAHLHGFGDSVSACFVTVDKAFAALGFPT